MLATSSRKIKYYINDVSLDKFLWLQFNAVSIIHYSSSWQPLWGRGGNYTCQSGYCVDIEHFIYVMSTSGGFKSQPCQELLTGPPKKTLFSGPPQKKKKKKKRKEKKREKVKGKGKVMQATGSKGTSGIAGGGGRKLFLFFCFCFSLFETTEICFGSTKQST